MGKVKQATLYIQSAMDTLKAMRAEWPFPPKPETSIEGKPWAEFTDQDKVSAILEQLEYAHSILKGFGQK